MTTASWILPDHTSQTPSEYKRNIDACFMVAERFSTMFHCHEADPVAMKIVIEPGFLWDGTNLTDIAEQEVTIAAAPGSNSRIDRVVFDPLTGEASVIQGTVAVTPTAPNFEPGTQPLCRVTVASGTTAITNDMITDERVISVSPDPQIIEVFEDIQLEAAHMGNIIHIQAGPVTITLPDIATVATGARLEIVSNTAASQLIAPDFGDFLDGMDEPYRIPSFDRIVIQKITTDLSNHWVIVERPAYSVGQVIEQTYVTGSADQIMGRGWLPVNGAAVSRNAYGNLWAAFVDDNDNSPWGNGDGSTTFLIPDDRGRMTVCMGEGIGTQPRVLGEYGGVESHAITQAQMPNYIPPYSEPNHFHDLTPFLGPGPTYQAAWGIGALSGPQITISPQMFLSTVFSGITVHSGGSNQPHNNMQPYVVVHKFIKV